MDLSARFLPSESCGVFSLDGDDLKLDVLATRGDQRVVQCVQDHSEDGIVDWVLREQRPVVIEDMSTVEQAGVEVCSIMLVPLKCVLRMSVCMASIVAVPKTLLLQVKWNC